MDSLKENLQQRAKELERAQCTATSDPVSKEDINDIGDMEIESDNESQDTVQTPPPLMVEQSAAKPAVPLSPGHFQTHPPPQSFQPARYQQPRPPGNLPNMFNTTAGGNLIRETSPNFPIHPPTSQIPSNFQPRPLLMNLSTSFPHSTAPPLMQTRAYIPPNTYRPPEQNTDIPTKKNNMTVDRPPTLAVSSAIPSPAVVATLPSLPLNQRPSTDEFSAVGEDELSPSGNKPSLDERLQNMVAHKLFGNVVDYSDSTGSETKDTPYSPSADELPVSTVATPLEDDQDSIPTPNTGNVTPDDSTGSPQINLNNPILQALYKSQNSPERSNSAPESVDESHSHSKTQSQSTIPSHSHFITQPHSAQPKDDTMLSTVKTTYLQEILNTVKSVASPQTQESTAAGHTSLPASGDRIQPRSTAIKDIQITPKLTNLLDQIFPQLSKSLQMDRKRKSVDLEEQSSNDVPSQAKHLRLTANDDHPSTVRSTAPPQRMLSQHPRSTFSPDTVNPQPFSPRVPGMPHPNHSSFQGGPLPTRFRAPPPDQMSYSPYGLPRPPSSSFSPRPNHMPSASPVTNFQQHDIKPRAPTYGYGPMGPHPSVGRGGPLHNQGARPPMTNFRPSMRPRFV